MRDGEEARRDGGDTVGEPARPEGAVGLAGDDEAAGGTGDGSAAAGAQATSDGQPAGGQPAPGAGAVPGSLWWRQRLGVNQFVEEALYHPVPKRTSFTDLLGLFTAFAFVNEIVTGILLLFFYRPTTAAAWQSVHALQLSPAGSFIRGLHYWGANAMIVLVGMHMLRALYVSAYRRPRELQWVTGVLMLGIVVVMGFTGYLLPWDQQAYWATTVGTAMPLYVPVAGQFLVNLIRGGPWVTGATLSRFFAIHVALLPLTLAVLMGVHVYLVFANGQTEVERALPAGYREKHRMGDTSDFPREGFRPFWPYTVLQMLGGCLVLLAVLVILALHYPAPLLAQADPLNRADYNPTPLWYFLWVYQLLKYTPPALDSVVMAGLPVVGGLLLLLLPFLHRGRWHAFRQGPVAVGVTGALTIAVLGLTYLGSASAAPLPPAAVIAQPSFARNVQPLLVSQCGTCHVASASGGLSLKDYAGLMKGGASGPVVTPGHPESSLLIDALEGQTNAAGVPQMPMGAAPLPHGDVQTIANWIREGAPNN